MTPLTTLIHLSPMKQMNADVKSNLFPVGDVPARALPQDGCPLLHRQEQVPAGPRVQEEDHLLPRRHLGKNDR